MRGLDLHSEEETKGAAASYTGPEQDRQLDFHNRKTEMSRMIINEEIASQYKGRDA